MRVLIYGGTGSQASPLVRELVKRGHWPYVLTRKPEKHPELVGTAAQVLRGDLNDADSLIAASVGMDAVMFMVPAFLPGPLTGADYARRAMEAAARAAVRVVVWNTSGRFPDPGEERESAKQMLATWQVLKSAGLPLITIAPTTYMENLLGPWTVKAIRTRGQVAYPVLPDRKMGWIASRDVCALMTAALERPETVGKVYRVSGVEALTGPELAAAFSEVLRRRVSYYAMSPQEMKEELEAAFGPGSGDEVATEYALDQAAERPPAKHYDMSTVLREIPVTMTSIRQWVRENIGHFNS